jgi:hypothetical protein
MRGRSRQGSDVELEAGSHLGQIASVRLFGGLILDPAQLEREHRIRVLLVNDELRDEAGLARLEAKPTSTSLACRALGGCTTLARRSAEPRIGSVFIVSSARP